MYVHMYVCACWLYTVCVCMDVHVGFSPSILSRIPPLSLPNGHYILPSITFSFPPKDFLIFNPSKSIVQPCSCLEYTCVSGSTGLAGC